MIGPSLHSFMESVDLLRYWTFKRLKEVFDPVLWRMSRNFSYDLRHDHHTNVVSTQLPTTSSQPRYLSLRAFKRRS